MKAPLHQTKIALHVCSYIYGKRNFFIVLLITVSTAISAQVPFWSNNGNNASTGDFLGTNNNQPLLFKSNGIEALRINPNGDIRFNAFANAGSGLLWSNNGVLSHTAFTNDTNQVLTGNGTFRNLSSISGWTINGNLLYSSPGLNVGIGITNQQYVQYPLTVNGDAWFTGTVYAQGIILTDKLFTDTLKATSMFSLNNNMHMSAGGVNQIYTSTGDIRFQSNVGNGGNTIFSAGTNGNVGIGTFSPQYKLDVTGQVRFMNDVFVSRLRPLPGDSIIRFGDSTIYLNQYSGSIHNNNTTGYRGMGIGASTYAYGLHSTAIGYRVRASADASVVIGSVSTPNTSLLFNTIPSSLMIGFDSNLPTLFIGPGNGMGTLGKVGIGTTNPEALFQIGNSTSRIVFDQIGSNQQGFTSYIGFNAHRDPATGIITFNGDGVTNNSGSLIMQDDEGALRFYVKHSSGGSAQTTLTHHAEQGSIMTLRETRVQIGQSIVAPGSLFDNGTQLSVDGRIVCKDLVVQIVDWQDEVFDSTYTLTPLDSVASYIKANNHLPGYAPEAEIEQNGMSVSETAAQQQKTIEEMMLYIIQLNERLMALEEENHRLKEEQPK